MQQENPDIIDGYLITKDKRHEIFGKVAGGANSNNPERYQRSEIEKYTKTSCNKTNMRINLRTKELVSKARPNVKNDGFDYSEDFDGIQSVNNNTIYINLKCIVGKGGNQTRSLREVYWFIEGQLNILKNVKNIYFANILDGDESHYHMPKYEYLLALPEFEHVKDNVYIGDLKGYITWFNKVSTDPSDAQ